MWANLAKDESPFATTSHIHTSAVVVDTWYYFVYSFTMTGGRDTDIDLFLDNTTAVTSTVLDTFIIDNDDAGAYIGLERTDTSTYAKHWNGYIYDFNMYVAAHTVSDTTHATTCDSGCLTIAFGEHESGTCHGTCSDRSCVKEYSC